MTHAKGTFLWTKKAATAFFGTPITMGNKGISSRIYILVTLCEPEAVPRYSGLMPVKTPDMLVTEYRVMGGAST